MAYKKLLTKLRILADKVHKELEAEEDKIYWKELLEVLLDNVSEYDQRLLEPVLELQWKYLQDNKKYDRYGEYSTNGVIPKVIIPAVRRIYADFPIRKLVGVQHQCNLVGKVYSLEYTNPPSKKMTLDVIANDVEAGSRRLSAHWTPVKEGDLAHMYGLDIEAEKCQVLSQEIRAEITDEVLQDLKKIAGEPEVVKLDPKNLGSKGEGSILALACRIRANCSSIARTTRRGHGNWIVVSKAMAITLSEEATTEVEIADDYEPTKSELLEVGAMNETVRIFVTDVPDDEILVGYKGGNGETDSGYFYTPHTPLMTGGYVLHPETFEPFLSFFTRYGKFVTEKAPDYYRNIKVEGKIKK